MKKISLIISIIFLANYTYSQESAGFEKYSYEMFLN